MPRTVKFDAVLLAAVRREVARLRAVNLHNLPSDRATAAAIRTAVNDANDGVVTADFAVLLGRGLSVAELKACQRAATRLEASGKLRRLRLGYDGARTTHLQVVQSVGEAGGEA